MKKQKQNAVVKLSPEQVGALIWKFPDPTKKDCKHSKARVRIKIPSVRDRGGIIVSQSEPVLVGYRCVDCGAYCDL